MIALGALGQAALPADKRDTAVTRDTTKFDQIYLLGLQGSMAEGLKFLDSLDPESVTERQQEERQRYFARFRAADESYVHRTSDTSVVRIIDMYHSYWRRALLDHKSLARFDTLLADSISNYLLAHDSELRGRAGQEIRDDFPRHLQEYLRRRGVYSATGKTGLFFDLLLHTEETESNYRVTTPEDTIRVRVVFMENMISNGWEEYATFGKYFPGGWATGEALYCAKETYDTTSENFTVSYLKHEGKHFADYKKFPKLTGADLEYRAKLVELSAAQESLYELIGIFIRNSATDRQNPHAFANHCVIRDLSQACGLKGDNTSIASWEAVPATTLNAQAERLLKKNSLELSIAGADKVESFIR